MSGLLIDDRGRSWPANRHLARRMGFSGPLVHLPKFAVRERGFIHLDRNRGIARVSIREEGFSLLAFMGVVLELGRMDPAHIVLRVFGERQPVFYVFAEPCDFAAKARALAAGMPAEPLTLPRLVEPRDLGVLDLTPFCCARPVIELWRGTRGELTDDVEVALHKGGVFDRTILTRQLPRSERLMVEKFGSAIKFLAAAEIIGREVADQPDREYGAWTAESYNQAIFSGRPCVESCHALIRKSKETALRVRYDRVLLPWRGPRSDRYAMCISIERREPALVELSKLVIS